MSSSTAVYHHLAFGVVTRVGLTRRLGVGPAISCADSSGKVRLLLADGKYWRRGPLTREYQQRDMLKMRLRRSALAEGRA